MINLPPPASRSQPPPGFLDHVWKKLTIGAIVGGILLEVTTRSLSPWVTSGVGYAYDAVACGGRAAMMEGDRLSEAASQDVTRAQTLFREANSHYAKAYACGFPDAGIRLAANYCLGLGAPKDNARALQVILEIEDRHEAKRGRAGDVRRACKL